MKNIWLTKIKKKKGRELVGGGFISWCGERKMVRVQVEEEVMIKEIWLSVGWGIAILEKKGQTQLPLSTLRSAFIHAFHLFLPLLPSNFFITPTLYSPLMLPLPPFSHFLLHYYLLQHYSTSYTSKYFSTQINNHQILPYHFL